MPFISKNEVDKFDYRDCIAISVKISENNLCLELEALIVKASNSQNTNFTNSYADVTSLVIHNVELQKIIKEGYKRYDANDKLIEEIPDTEVPLNTVNLSKMFTKTFLIGVKHMDGDQYILEFEMPDDDPNAVTEVYEVRLNTTDVVFHWDRYLNRTQYD